MCLHQSDFYQQLFSSEDELLSFLENDETPYSAFILSVYRRPSPSGATDVHHIQPKHANGTDDPWNLINLTIEEHAKAHQLMYESYGNKYDKGAWLLMDGQTVEGRRAIWEQNQATMRENGVGFNDPATQRELATRPRNKRKPYLRNEYVKAALERGFILKSVATGATVEIKAGECATLHNVMDLWLSHPELKQQKEQWQQAPVKQSFSLYTGLTRIITGHVDKKTKKSVFTVAGWFIQGILL